MYAIERGLHVLVTKPAVQLLSHHNDLIAAAKRRNVICFVEHHKRLTTFFPSISDYHAHAHWRIASTPYTAMQKLVLPILENSTFSARG